MAEIEQTTSNVKAKAEEAAQDVKETAQDVAEQAKAKAQELVDRAPVDSDSVAQTAEDVEAQARELADQAQAQAKSALTERKSMAAGELDSIAAAFRQTSQELRAQDQGALAQYSRSAADQVDQLATYMQSRTIDDMLVDAEDFARQQPELFLGGAFALGLLVARFFKSSSARRQSGSTWGRLGEGGARVRSYGTGYGAESRTGDYGTDEYELAPRPRPLPQRDVTDEARLSPRTTGETEWE
ncbi:MAG: hypothetical protein R3272_04540 [Candidatus Promineifilaceae bacterium]|nr:hypothetical protein [Candidatus Promineifilaceae bacterium]